ncbi:unknown [Roseburia sp. CAG:50]|nr:unknown [Roseburia sp. CAG:50]
MMMPRIFGENLFEEKFRRSKNPMLNENNTSVTPNVQTIKTITERSNDL